MTVVCIHQPDFAPWLGFFHRLCHCDVFIVLDDVQFLRRGWHHRDQIKTASGTRWLTVPVKKKGRYGQEIRDVEIDDSIDWRRRHYGLLKTNYARAPHFELEFEALRDVYGRRHRRLIDFNLDLIRHFCARLDLPARFSTASEIGRDGSSTARLVSLTRAVGGSVYLTGTGARAYLEESLFEASGIGVRWQDFAHPIYPQSHGSFVPRLSVIDCLFNCGAAETARLLRDAG